MISWSDIGIVVTSTKKQEKYQAVDIFTENHGLVKALCDADIRISALSLVSIDWKGRNRYAMGFWRIQDLRQPTVLNTLHSILNQRVCYFLHRILPYGDRAPELFAYVKNMASKICICQNSLERLNLYAYFEFLLLKSMGYGFDLQICVVCGNLEKIEYISKVSGRGISKKCRGVVREEVFQVPDEWAIWEKNGYYPTTTEATLQSISITGYFIKHRQLIRRNSFHQMDTALRAVI